MGLEFEWDEDKARINWQKHGVSFDTATLVFKDEERIEIYDEKHSIDEDRYITIGLAGEVLFVVYTERKDTIRKWRPLLSRPAGPSPTRDSP